MVLLAPIMKDVGIQYEEVRFNGSLFLFNAYRMDAGPEVDAAWKSLGVDCKWVDFSGWKCISNVPPDHAARVPAKEAQRSGLAVDQVKIKEEYGGGYPAHVEGLHHLHCLVSVVAHPCQTTLISL